MSSNAGAETPPEPGHDRHGSFVRRSWVAMSDILLPFSSGALASLPRASRPARYLRADAIPHTEGDENGQQPTVRDYHSINALPPQVRVPKKIPTPIRVEGKVWFANERTWIAWLNNSILLAALSAALFNASKDPIAKNFAYFYASVSLGVLLYGYLLYQHRITMIRRRDPGHFDVIAGPVVVCVLLFFGMLLNFLLRVRELREKGVPIPGTGFFTLNPNNTGLFQVQT
ncbi:hypothetical protein BDN72DRAFT_850055 [Pluteus cervinus]|uniref:Uncharacterized protein n=1 Tax=Pluteus cervinus TaxID=181527 RepID=A0ACD3A823_9AGAR|nr:hypothetical protein BDN72DRAFT_850055 [Pluteus cervinus]